MDYLALSKANFGIISPKNRIMRLIFLNILNVTSPHYLRSLHIITLWYKNCNVQSYKFFTKVLSRNFSTKEKPRHSLKYNDSIDKVNGNYECYLGG